MIENWKKKKSIIKMFPETHVTLDTSIILSPRKNSCFTNWYRSHLPFPPQFCQHPSLNTPSSSSSWLPNVSPATAFCLFLLLRWFLERVIPPFHIVLNGAHHSSTSLSTRFMWWSNAMRRPVHTPLTPAQCRVSTLTLLPSTQHWCRMEKGPLQERATDTTHQTS